MLILIELTIYTSSCNYCYISINHISFSFSNSRFVLNSNKLYMEQSYIELAKNLVGSGVKVGKFRADGAQKEFGESEL